MMATYFETVEDLLASFGPVRDCSTDNGGCKKNFKCVSDRQLESSGCMVSDNFKPGPLRKHKCGWRIVALLRNYWKQGTVCLCVCL